MKKSCCFVILFLAGSFAYSAQAQALDKISKVSIDGLQNVKASKVLAAVKLKKNKHYTASEARDDVRAILELGYFDGVDVNFNENNGNLVFAVTERPYIEKIVFNGNNEFGGNKLKSKSLLKEKEFYDILKLEETKQKITALYADEGYADMTFEVYPTIDSDANKMTVTFLITEGNKITLEKVKLDGITAFKKRKVRKLLKTKRGKIFNNEVFQKDLKNIEAFYKDRGFMDFKVALISNAYNDDRTKMTVEVGIDEGEEYKIGGISLDIKTSEGHSAVPYKDMRKAVKFKKGEIFNQSRILQTLQEAYELYSDKGYLHAEISPAFDKDERRLKTVNVRLQIQENEIVYLGNVYIDGLVSTKEKVVGRELLLKPGDPLSSKKVRRSVERIYNLGFIDGVEPQILPTSAPNVMELLLSVTEGRPGMITAGAGYSSVDQFIGSIQLQHMNLFGLAQRLNILWEFGERRQNYEVGWTEPWIFNKNASLNLSVYNIQRLRDYGSYTDAYEEKRIGFSAKVGPRISDKVALLFGYNYENVDLHDFANDRVKELITSATNVSQDRNANISAQTIYDSRDYIYDASRGNRQSLTLVLGSSFLGGNVNFLKGMAKSTWFFPTFWKFVLSVNVMGGLVSNYGASERVPLYERFYIGGADTVRGYKYMTEIGPEDGGKVMTVMNIEYKFPLVSERGRSVLQGAFFYDIGGAWSNYNDMNFSLGTEKNNLRSGVGFGIRFATPVFPLRLDWGYGLNHKDGEPLQQFYFTIGNVF